MGPSKISGRRRDGHSSNDGRTFCSGEDFSDGMGDFKALLMVILSPEGMEPPVLKNLYEFLLRLSSNSQCIVKYAAASNDFDFEMCSDGIQVAYGDISHLSGVLFKELGKRFEQLYVNLCGISDSKDPGESSSCLGLLDALEVMKFLFRCCLLLLTLPEPRQHLFWERGQILFGILRRLSLPSAVEHTRKHEFIYEKTVFRECSPGNNGFSTSYVEDLTASLQFLEPYNPLYFFLSTMLEVFIDELLVNEQLRKYLKVLNFFGSINEIPSKPDSGQADIAVVIESICSHFIISFSDVQTFKHFLDNLFCAHFKGLKHPFREPALGVSAAVSLFLSPIMTSAPKYVHAHLFSLVSESIDIKSLKPDRKLTNCLLSTFEKSVTLYMKHMSCLQTESYATVASDFTSSSSNDIAHPPFECFMLPETKIKVESLVTKLDNSSDSIMNGCCFKMKSELVSSSMRFVKEYLNEYAMSCEDEILTILSCLVLKASECCDDKALPPINGTSLRQLYFLATLLKLMSISLLQTVWCLRHRDDLGNSKRLEDFSSCKEYDFILGVVSAFRDIDTSLPLQKDLSNVILECSTRPSDSKMMFLHFSGLMSVCFLSGLDCLVKACLLIILALLNLFVFEEGNLEALQSFVDSSKDALSSELSVIRLHETVVDQSSSLVVASKFQRARSLYSRTIEKNYNEIEASSSECVAAVAGLEEETEETSTGEIFLRCMLRTGGNVPDFNDLSGFVECKQGKDYSAWLKSRQKYRRWRSEKMAVLKWKKKKKTWRTLKIKRN